MIIIIIWNNSHENVKDLLDYLRTISSLTLVALRLFWGI